MACKISTCTGKIKVSYAFRPQSNELPVQMSESARAQGNFLSDLIQAEARRRQAPDLAARFQNLEAGCLSRHPSAVIVIIQPD